MAQFTFPIVLSGSGETAEAAWDDAVDGFSLDPGTCPGPEERSEEKEGIEEAVQGPIQNHQTFAKFGGKPMILKYYCVVMIGGLEPVLHGPYETEDFLDTVIKAVHASLDEDDNLFGLGVDETCQVYAWTYSNGFFEEDL